MRNIITALIVTGMLVFTGCVTTSEADLEKKKVEEPKAADHTVKEEAKIEEKVQIRKLVNTPYVVKETEYYNDGYIENYKVFTFNDDMNPAREDMFDSFDEIIESVVYEKISDNVTKRSLFNARGEIQSWKILTCNSAGFVEKSESFNSEGQLQSLSKYSYDEHGNKLNWSVADSDGVVLSDTKYIYKDGLNIRIEIYDAGANLVEYFGIDYSGNMPVRKNHYQNEKLVDAVEYVYNDGNLAVEKALRANGSVSRTVKYVNDEYGSPVKAEYFDGNGDLKDWTETEYEYISEEIIVWE